MGKTHILPVAVGVVLFLLSLSAERLIAFDPTLPGPLNRLELLPYIALLAAAIVAPVMVLIRTGRFHILSPLVHVSWTYLIPMLVVGSVVFVGVGISDIPAGFLRDPPFDFRLTLIYLTIGLAALGLGAVVGIPYRFGILLGAKLPRLQWGDGESIAAGIALILFGTMVQYLNFRSGLIGYQIGSGGALVAVWYYVGLTFQMGIFLIWYAIFRAGAIKPLQWSAGAFSIICMLAVAILAGSRGLLPACWIIVVLAFFTAKQRPTRLQLVSLALAGCVALGAGFTLGTLFRYVKATTVDQQAVVQRAPAPTAPIPGKPPGAASDDEGVAGRPASPQLKSSQDVAQHAQRTVTLRDQTQTVGEAINMATSENMPIIVRSFAARLNVLSQVAVLTSQRDALRESMPETLKSGILIGIATSLVPRILWPNKPVIGDSVSYARLFFQFEGNSFAVTPVGDLLLNFGPVGIVPGMLILGFCMSLLFATIVAGAPQSPARAAIMVALLTQFSMEGFLAPLVPSMIRAGIVAVAAIAIIHIALHLRAAFLVRSMRA